MREVIAAIREGMPSADQMQPGQVFQHVLEALHDCSKKDRNTNSSICFVPRYLNGGRLSLAQGYDGSRDAIKRIVFQAHSPRNGLFKREPDIVGTNAGRDRHKGLRTLLRYLANGL